MKDEIFQDSPSISPLDTAAMASRSQRTLKRGRSNKMTQEPRTSLRGRDARTGEFTTVEKARQHKSTHVVERVPKPGYGDTKKK